MKLRSKSLFEANSLTKNPLFGKDKRDDKRLADREAQPSPGANERMGENNNNEFHGFGGNTTSQGGYDGFDEPLYWKYPALQDLEWEGTLICLPPKLTSLSNNFAPKVLPLSMFPPSETTTTPVPPMLPPMEDTTYVQPNLQDQLSALQNINSGNNTLDYRQTQFLNRAPNQVAPMWSGS
ncbi:hypothetical protein JHK87_052615 [Glycine soja]|nr:hypothetical protein JHK87_052615 [Glycine soja]